MVPGYYDMTIYRGGTFEIDFSAKDDDGDISFAETYNKAELVIYEAWFTTVDPTPPVPLYTLSTEDGTIVIAGTIVRVHLPAAITLGLPLVSGVYRMRLIVDGPDPIIDPFMEGAITIKN